MGALKTILERLQEGCSTLGVENGHDGEGAMEEDDVGTHT